MRDVLDASERMVERVVAPVSGPVVGALAVALYAGIGLALPLTIHSTIAGLVVWNLAGTTLGVMVLIAWVAVRVQANHRRHLVEWTTELRHLDSTEFEWLVGELFRREGWKVEETGRPDGPDGNIDLKLVRNGERRIVQCKRWESWPVGVDEVRNFSGTLMRERLTGSDGIFVTLSSFGSQARQEAETIRLTLLDGKELWTRIENVRRAEPCPVCNAPMRLGRSSYGWWFRCTEKGCPGKRNLDKAPGRAVELLTERN